VRNAAQQSGFKTYLSKYLIAGIEIIIRRDDLPGELSVLHYRDRNNFQAYSNNRKISIPQIRNSKKLLLSKNNTEREQRNEELKKKPVNESKG